MLYNILFRKGGLAAKLMMRRSGDPRNGRQEGIGCLDILLQSLSIQGEKNDGSESVISAIGRGDRGGGFRNYPQDICHPGK
jgi:hypothetical protein